MVRQMKTWDSRVWANLAEPWRKMLYAKQSQEFDSEMTAVPKRMKCRNGRLRILAKTLSGFPFCLKQDTHITCKDVKAEVTRQTNPGVPAENQRMVSKSGHEYREDDLITEPIVYVVLRLRGGRSQDRLLEVSRGLALGVPSVARCAVDIPHCVQALSPFPGPRLFVEKRQARLLPIQVPDMQKTSKYNKDSTMKMQGGAENPAIGSQLLSVEPSLASTCVDHHICWQWLNMDDDCSYPTPGEWEGKGDMGDNAPKRDRSGAGEEGKSGKWDDGVEGGNEMWKHCGCHLNVEGQGHEHCWHHGGRQCKRQELKNQ
eukprot:TRINITY_DN58160_c0_g1_i1.p1 TRINITY_DN58160_c0_g1~~TRINITY_DN58160_c0_g1_i1.p1  ORF type:complete len:315 (+),score=13.51 TRINITY_DN58160_c0_g1_i1:192-1136(+)